METIAKGGYAEVFYDPTCNDVFRRMPRNNPHTGVMDISAMNDLVFTRSFEHTTLTPMVYSVEISKEYLSYRMPHYGTSLHQWTRTEPIDVRKRHAAGILMQIVQACLHFERNGFLHCDLKPSNIMIETKRQKSESDRSEDLSDDEDEDDDRTPMVHIIDFNCASVRMVDEETMEDTMSWGIGTWKYMPPEIILHERPCQKSISWTIGLLAAYIVDGFPFTGEYLQQKDNKLTEQEMWQLVMYDWHNKYPEHVPIRSGYGDAWERLVHGCTHWNNADRWSLMTIHKHVHQELMKSDAPSPWQSIEDVPMVERLIDASHLSESVRQHLVDRLYALCEETKNLNMFPTAVVLMDRACGVAEPEVMARPGLIAAAAFLFSGFMNSVDVLQSKKGMSKMSEYLGYIDQKQATSAMCYIAHCLRWALWEKPVHVILVDYGWRPRLDRQLFPRIRDVLLCQKGKYTQSRVAEEILGR